MKQTMRQFFYTNFYTNLNHLILGIAFQRAEGHLKCDFSVKTKNKRTDIRLIPNKLIFSVLKAY